ADDTAYIAPFAENLRMRPLGYAPFHWREETPGLADDATAIDAVAQQIVQSPPQFSGALPDAATWLDSPGASGPGLARIDLSPPDPGATSWTVDVTLAAAVPDGARVRVLYKSFASEADWGAVDASGANAEWTAIVPGTGDGALFAVEVAAGGAG